MTSNKVVGFTCLYLRQYLTNDFDKKGLLLWDRFFRNSAHATLKGPKHEIFESVFFTQIRRLWLGDLGTGEKNLNFDSCSHYFKVFAANFLLSVRSACA